MSNRDFLETVWGEVSGNVAIAFATGKNHLGKLQVNEYHWFKYPEEFDAAVALADKPQRGYRQNRYFTPHAYGEAVQQQPDGEPILDKDGNTTISRSAANSQMVQVVPVDSDSFPYKDFLLEPSIHLQTSEDHGQDFFVLTTPIESPRIARLSRQIVEAHKADGLDVSTWAANKVMRLPVAKNTKNDKKPWDITSFDVGLRYDVEEVEAKYAHVEVKRASSTTHQTYSDVTPESLGDPKELLQKIPATERRLNELIWKTPMTGDKGWRSEQRWALLSDLIRHGFTAEEATAIAWVTPSAKKWKEDGAGRGIGGLLGEAKKAEIEVKAENAARNGSTPAPELKPPTAEELAAGRLNLLSIHERGKVAARTTVDVFYYEFIRERAKVFNAPYHRNNLAVYLATAFGDLGYIPRKDGKMPLNIFTTSIGGSSTGKTEADRFFWMFTNRLYPHDDVLISGQTSKNAFIEHLVERREKVCVFNEDEADGFFEELLAKAGGTAGLQSQITKAYDGPVPSVGRVGRTDLKVPQGAWVSMSSKFFGTPTGMMKVLNRDQFLTGFLARQQWAVGLESVLTRAMMEESQVEGEIEASYEILPTFFAQMFNLYRSRFRQNPRRTKDGRFPMLCTEEALQRIAEAKWDVVQHFKGHPDEAVLDTAMKRSFDVLRKMATLFAMSEGREYVDTSHVLIAIKYLEEWMIDLEKVIGMISDNAISRSLDDIEKIIADRGHTPVSMIYRRRKAELKFTTDQYITQLMVQGRIEAIDRVPGQEAQYKIREDRTRS